MPESARSAQQKPLFKVLEESAIDKSFAAKELRRTDKAVDQVLRQLSPRPFADASPVAVASPTYPFSFPLCDLLICELDTAEAKIAPFYISPKRTLHQSARTATALPAVHVAVRGVVSVAEYIYQKVVRRKPVPFIPSTKDLKHLGCYVVETLECGHTVDIHPSEIEPLTAHKRTCHECSGWMGGLQIGKRKAPASVKGITRKRKIAGESPWWAVGFAVLCAGALVGAIVAHKPTGYTYSAPDNYFRVLEKINDFDFAMQRVYRGIPQAPTVLHFCRDYKPMFEAGMTLQWLAYDDRGSCQSLAPADKGYVIVRGGDHSPLLAPNCAPDFVSDRVSCDGKPKFD